MIQHLVDDKLLRNVRTEIREHISFTPKETDIYKIHQSGDLANLDGLDDAALTRLPSLLTLRDSLYSPAFRQYLSAITRSGPLSGLKTDMAVVRRPRPRPPFESPRAELHRMYTRPAAISSATTTSSAVAA